MKASAEARGGGKAAANPFQSVLLVSLQEAEAENLRGCFREDGADLISVKEQVASVVLPRIRDALGWESIRASKGRVNDARTVSIKYNSLFHRDRHLYGEAPEARLQETCWHNRSAVVYLDRSRLEFLEGSEVAGDEPAPPTCKEIPAGSIAVFPSSLIHRARPWEESGRRRTIVLFDVENPEEHTPVPHNIVYCPAWTQKPLLDGIFGGDNVEKQMVDDLVANKPYFWRYYKRGGLTRTHWQVTTPVTGCTGTGKEGRTIPYNTSFYLIGPSEYPEHVQTYDHRNTLLYLANIARFHLGFEVLN